MTNNRINRLRHCVEEILIPKAIELLKEDIDVDAKFSIVIVSRRSINIYPDGSIESVETETTHHSLGGYTYPIDHIVDYACSKNELFNRIGHINQYVCFAKELINTISNHIEKRKVLDELCDTIEKIQFSAPRMIIFEKTN